MATWNAAWELLPKNSQSPTEIDDAVRAVKGAAERRARNEHETYNDSTGGDETLDWRHKEGSARCWFQSAAPTNSPSSGTLKDGHLWVDSDTNILYVYDETAAAWEALGLVIPNCTSDPGSPVVGQMWLRTDLV